MVNPVSSDTDEALDSLFLSPARDSHSPVAQVCSSSDSELFEDWPEANDTTASVYIALSADALSSRASVVDSVPDIQESRAGVLSTQKSHRHADSSKKHRRQKAALANASWGRPKKMKIDATRALAVLAPLTLIDHSAKLCTLFLLLRVLSILLIMWTDEMSDVSSLCSGCVVHLHVLLPYMYLCSLPSSGFSCRLRALVSPLTART
jgi:hypothetical protein